MASVFETLKETIEDAHGRQMPEAAKLILWGRIIQSVGRDELSQVEALQLEDLLGPMRDQYAEAFDLALFGEVKTREETASTS